MTTTTQQSTHSTICQALLELQEGRVEMARCILGEAIEDAVANMEEPDDALVLSKNWLDLDVKVSVQEAKSVLQKAAWRCR